MEALHRLGQERFACSIESCKFTSARKDNLRQHRQKIHKRLAELDPSRGPSTLKDDVSEPSQGDDDHAHLPPESSGPWIRATFLHAATAGNLEVLEATFQIGIDIHSTADDESTALHCAARTGQALAVGLLLNRGADMAAKNSKGRSPLQEAILGNQVATVELMIRAGAQQDDLQITGTCIARSGSLAMMQVCIASLDESRRDALEHSVRLAASRLGQVELMSALLLGETTSQKMLRKSGENELNFPWLKYEQHAGKYRAMHYAALQGHLGVIRALVAHGFDVNVTARWRTPLHLAAAAGHTTVVEYLLSLKETVVNCKTWDDQTSLHFAARSGQLEVVRILLKHPEVNINDSDVKERTPLLLAVASGCVELVQLFLEHTEMDIYRRQHGQTPVQLSAFYGHWSIMQALLDHEDKQANVGPPHVPSEKVDLTPSEIMHRILRHADFANVNVYDKCSWNWRYFYGQGLLHMTVRTNEIGAMRMLLYRSDIDVNLLPKYFNWTFRTPLQLALELGHLEAAKLLLQHDKILVNFYAGGKAPLIIAKENQYDDLVGLLIARGARDDATAVQAK